LRRITVVESVSTLVSITDGEALGLNLLGRRLANRAEQRNQEANQSSDRVTAIRCWTSGHENWTISVDNAVGVISVAGLQIVVRPKIPVTHLLYLFVRAGSLPRFVAEVTEVPDDANFLDLVANWYVQALQTLLVGDIMRDYVEERDSLKVLRGTLQPYETARLFFSGQFRFAQIYENFDVDIPLNRILKEAARRIVGMLTLAEDVRRKARRSADRFNVVGDVTGSDLRVDVDRRTANYRDALLLAKLILNDIGRGMDHGSENGWSFLIPTPAAVEHGLREILNDDLAVIGRVYAETSSIGNGMKVHPDLWFESYEAVGDIKYKLLGSKWDRGDLYQSVAFAAATGTKQAIVVGFSQEAAALPCSAHFGDINVSAVAMARKRVREAG
jgi:5-methylcytosine-specific restriction endonuclease McrBC regulatory subunit McrC